MAPEEELKIVALLTEIKSDVETLGSNITTNYMKIIDDNTKTIREQSANYKQLTYALIASIGATIGVKFLGSPPWVELLEYATLFSGLFMLINLIARWKVLPPWRRIFIGVFSLFMAFSSTAHLWLRNTEGLLPFWFNPTINGFLLVLAAISVYGMWRYKWK